MGKKTVTEHIYIEAQPRHSGDFGGFVSSYRQPDDEHITRANARDLAAAIKQRCSDLLATGSSVAVREDSRQQCEHCDAAWTNGNEPHNEGCCDYDDLVMRGIMIGEMAGDVVAFQDGNQIALVRYDFVNLQESPVLAWIPVLDDTKPDK